MLVSTVKDKEPLTSNENPERSSTNLKFIAHFYDVPFKNEDLYLKMCSYIYIMAKKWK